MLRFYVMYQHKGVTIVDAFYFLLFLCGEKLHITLSTPNTLKHGSYAIILQGCFPETEKWKLVIVCGKMDVSKGRLILEENLRLKQMFTFKQVQSILMC